MARVQSMSDVDCRSQFPPVLPSLPQWPFCSSMDPLASYGDSSPGGMLCVLSWCALLLFPLPGEIGGPRWDLSLSGRHPDLSLPAHLQRHPAATVKLGEFWRDRGVG